MDCSLIQGDLALHHLGAIDDLARDRVDAHLLECSECLRTYLSLKRQAERGAARPSARVRERLRADVAEAFRKPARARARGWIHRPIPLYQGLAAVLAVILLAVVAPLLVDTRPAPRAGGERVDTARNVPGNLSFY